MPVSRSATATMSSPRASRASAIARSRAARPARPSRCNAGAAAAAAAHRASTCWFVVVEPTTWAMLPVRGSMLTISVTSGFLPSCEMVGGRARRSGDGRQLWQAFHELQARVDQLAELPQVRGGRSGQRGPDRTDLFGARRCCGLDQGHRVAGPAVAELDQRNVELAQEGFHRFLVAGALRAEKCGRDLR